MSRNVCAASLWVTTLILLSTRPVRSDTYNATACLFQYANLTCTATNGQISVTSADYAQQPGCPSGTCCRADPGDCFNDIATEDPDKWEEILTSCNNQTSCSIQLRQTTINSREGCAVSPYDLDYMIIRYDCLLDTTTAEPTTTPLITPPSTATATTTTTTRRTTSPSGGGDDDDDDDDTNVGAILGGVFAAILLVVLIVLLVYLIYRLKRKPPPKKRVAKRPSNAAGGPGRPGANRAPSSAANAAGGPGRPGAKRAPSGAANAATAPAAGAKRTSGVGAAYDPPKPPYAVYDNTAFEQDVQLTISNDSNGTNPNTADSSKANSRLSNGSLAGMADLRGNTPATNAATTNKHDNIVNERRAITAEYHKVKKRPAPNTERPPQASQLNNATYGNDPPPPSAAGHTRPKSTHYDTPKSKNGQVNRAFAPVQSDDAYEDVETKDAQAPPLEHKTVPLDAVEAK